MTSPRKPVRSGSSTGSPGIPTSISDQRNQYDPATTGYNSATGAGYKRPSGSDNYRPPSPTGSFDAPAGDSRISHAPSTAERVKMEKEMEKQQKASRSNQASEGVGKGIKGVAAGIHGAGETLRGALNATVDRAFGSHESAEWNEEIARRGEQEISSKDFKETPRRE
ncbi:hypothetical protein N7520_009449 [Penicillium odoratum]|uniref:uncharacterized protein n=1 Tax=Penicillium odoratum TaxID=1167516 RepID=UPI0025491168|nr:uncharacterized protein N7520_009449 [Penicillium odoratum]KAJ5752532.1 hypothetical protein N7520_009449 [Penicillium odoratum]